MEARYEDVLVRDMSCLVADIADFSFVTAPVTSIRLCFHVINRCLEVPASKFRPLYWSNGLRIILSHSFRAPHRDTSITTSNHRILYHCALRER
jgi:hypothetical protein